MRSSFSTAFVAGAALATSLACGKPDDRTAATDSMTTAMPASAMAGGDMGNMGNMEGMSGGMAGMANMTGDPDRDFLRMMSDHHSGLIAIAHLGKEGSKATATAKAEARKMDAKQDAELEKMQGMLSKTYSDSYEPKVMPSHKMMVDELEPLNGKAFDRRFYENVIAHHREAIMMVDKYLPTAKAADVKAMAEKMKADQTKEIADLQKKVAAIGA